MPHLDPRLILSAGFIAGGLLYFIVTFWERREFSFAHLFLAVMGGAATFGAANLMYLAWEPAHLVHVYDLKGQELPPESIKVTMSDWHFYEIFGGGVLFFFFELYLLIRAAKGHHH